MEAKSCLFLLDEDTSATNFMVRDSFMQKVIRREKEPITPFLERARDLYAQAGISTILVAGSSGAFFHIADTISAPLQDCLISLHKALCADYPLSAQAPSPFHMPMQHRIMTGPAPTFSHRDILTRIQEIS